LIAAKLNRDKLQVLAESKLAEARVLLDNRHWTGAYYQTGLAVECALKAYLARAIQQHDFPDKNFVLKAYTHKLKDLVQLDSALWTELRNEFADDGKLRSNWDAMFSWDDENRYELVDELQAKALYDAATEPGSGVMDWIRRRW
jgi:HEPN domain-containing protein